MLNKKKYERIISDLEDDKAGLIENNKHLEGMIEEHINEYNKLKEKYDELQKENDTLDKEYTELQRDREYWIALTENLRVRAMNAESKLRHKKIRLKYRR